MLKGTNVFWAQGKIWSDTKEGEKLDSIMIGDQFYIQYNNEEEKIVKYFYADYDCTFKEDEFWRILKAVHPDYHQLQLCPYAEDDENDREGPRQVNYSIVSMFEYVGMTERRWNQIPRPSYADAFGIENVSLKSKVFSNINIKEMIDHLGYERLRVDGKKVKRLFYDEIKGEEFEQEKHVMYALLKVKVSDLIKESAREEVYGYVIECRCSTTDEEHYLWIPDSAKTDAFEGIASTCNIQKSLKQHVKEIRRQGDIFFFGFADDFDVELIDEKEEKVPFTADEYFDLLVAET